jgi:hypothetical protein
MGCRVGWSGWYEAECGALEASVDQVRVVLDSEQTTIDGLLQLVAVREEHVGGGTASQQRPDPFTGFNWGE